MQRKTLAVPCLGSMTAPVLGVARFAEHTASEGYRTMKKTKKLGLRKETVRKLQASELEIAVGGLSGNHCSYGLTGCAACPPQRPSLLFSNCLACATDICTFE
jgi:hypothetical protein